MICFHNEIISRYAPGYNEKTIRSNYLDNFNNTYQKFLDMRIIKLICLLVSFSLTNVSFSQGTWCCWNGIEFAIVSAENAKSEISAAETNRDIYSSFDIRFVDATTNSDLPEGVGLAVSVTFSNVIVKSTVTQKYQRWGLFGDVVSERWAIAYTNTERYSSGAKSVNVNFTSDGIRNLTIPIDLDLPTKVIPDKFLNDHYTYTVCTNVVKADARVEVKVANYEPCTVNLTDLIPFLEERDIPLVHQINNVNLKGSINVNNLNSSGKSDNLNILTPSQIAEALGLAESDVLDLIRTQQLKAKKIGEKYFIRKEDFDDFMKK